MCLSTSFQTTPTQKTISADISSSSEILSFYSEENQEGLDIKEHEKQKRLVSTQLQWELESLILPTIALPDACVAMEEENIDNLHQVLKWTTKQQQPQDSSNTTTVTLAQDILLTHDDKAQNDAQPVNAVGEESSYLQNIQPYAMTMKRQEAHSTSYIAELAVAFPLLHEEEVRTNTQTDTLPTTDVPHMCQPWPPPVEEVHHRDSSDAPVTTLTQNVVLNVKGVAEESSTLQIAHFNYRIIHPAIPPDIPFIPIRALWNLYFRLADSNLQPYALVKLVRQPWDPGKMHVLQSVDHQWSYYGINTRMSHHKLFAQNELLHGMSLCLFEDQSVIHVLQETIIRITALCEDMQITPLMSPWDPGSLHFTHRILVKYMH